MRNGESQCATCTSCEVTEHADLCGSWRKTFAGPSQAAQQSLDPAASIEVGNVRRFCGNGGVLLRASPSHLADVFAGEALETAKFALGEQVPAH